MKQNKNVPHGTENEIIIPELEEAMERFNPRAWTPEEEAILKKYYKRVPTKDLLKYLPRKTENAIYTKAGRMGLVERIT
jgi:hypothetical protein